MQQLTEGCQRGEDHYVFVRSSTLTFFNVQKVVAVALKELILQLRTLTSRLLGEARVLQALAGVLVGCRGADGMPGCRGRPSCIRGDGPSAVRHY